MICNHYVENLCDKNPRITFEKRRFTQHSLPKIVETVYYPALRVFYILLVRDVSGARCLVADGFLLPPLGVVGVLDCIRDPIACRYKTFVSRAGVGVED